MVINTKGVEVSENIYVNKAGKFLFKIEKWEIDGMDSGGNDAFKIFFKGVEANTKEPMYLHSERFTTGQNALWKVKQLEIALKSPEVYELDSWIGRYVFANIVQENYTRKDGSSAISHKVKSWEYSTANDKLAPIPEARENSNDGPVIDIDEDEIPF